MAAARDYLAGVHVPVPAAQPEQLPVSVALTGEPLHVQQLAAYVHANAPLYGLDPAAMLAIASQEGIGGAIGDGGLAYGPWQDHVTEFNRIGYSGPVRNNQDVQAFMWSPDGVDFVMRSMVAAGAAGLTGYDAIVRMATFYERPRSDLLHGEIAGAWSQYNKWRGTA